jgi:hypothetical protein
MRAKAGSGLVKALALVALVPWLAAAAPKPGLTEAQQQCPFVRMSDQTRATLTPELYLGGLPEAKIQSFMQEAARLALMCASMTGVPETRQNEYFQYVAISLARSPLMAGLERIKLPLEAVHDGLDIGPGRSNAELTQFGELQQGAILFKLMDRKYPIETLREGEWKLIMGYAKATAELHRAEAKVLQRGTR